MSVAQDLIQEAISQIDLLKKNVAKSKSVQIRSSDELALLKTVSFGWFKSFRGKLTYLEYESMGRLDDSYNSLLVSSDKQPTRKSILRLIAEIRQILIDLRFVAVRAVQDPSKSHTADSPPDFSTLVADTRMQDILKRRWIECTRCLAADAPLAATVMIGGLIEALLLARVHREPNQAKVYSSKCTPIDKKLGKPKPLSDWALSDFINIAHDLKWISRPARDVGGVLREYRNYVHPHKEFSHGSEIKIEDVKVFWEIAKSLVRQLLELR